MHVIHEQSYGTCFGLGCRQYKEVCSCKESVKVNV